ncbi:PREDICTED: putative F-box protein At4g17200 [Brassica oleracea var. oleracea]|uniref:F-box domain-containing protein n=1 Tax=Brassica oleracea var. oleracea TaxID=109376 RepID=A0A0D2ZUU9_BRAOL|nr:PREDICTED: putative F-box protein At4g17200 [Brassica oleracea var. oleracea]
MTTISDLSRDLIGDILSKVPITCVGKVRCTCKQWNASSRHRIFGKAVARQFMGFMMMDFKVCLVRIDLNGIVKDEEGSGPVSIKPIDKLNKIEISKVFHCDGLLLSTTRDNTRLLVWNPYLGQMKWIEPKTAYHRLDRYALGYDTNKKSYKILRFVDDAYWPTPLFEFEIYDMNSNLWRALDVTPDWDIEFFRPGLTVKGNTYFFATQKIILDEGEADGDVDDFLVSFDFTKERFGPHLYVPFHSRLHGDTVVLSSVGEEKLAALYQCMDINMMEIWVTTKIEPHAVSWSKLYFLAVDKMVPLLSGSFFIDEEKKLALAFTLDTLGRYKRAYIIGEDEYFKQVDLGEAVLIPDDDDYPYCFPLVCSYVPSLVQINQGLVLSGKRKER